MVLTRSRLALSKEDGNCTPRNCTPRTSSSNNFSKCEKPFRTQLVGTGLAEALWSDEHVRVTDQTEEANSSCPCSSDDGGRVGIIRVRGFRMHQNNLNTVSCLPPCSLSNCPAE